MDSPEYAELFPDTVLPTAADRSGYSRQSNAFEIIGHRGSYRSVGIGGGITGRGADYLIIDDPIKNDKEADSITYRESNWEWYGSTAYTRLEKDACVLVIMTQWHEDDLAGRLERQMRDDPDADQWEVLRLPAILETLEGKHPEDPREIGQALWPRKYDEQKLKSMKATIGSRFWNALFQQRPSALAGNVIKREWLQNRYKALPDRFDEIIQSWDCSFEGNDTSDYVVGQVWGRVAAKFFLIDQIRERLGYTDTKAMIKSVSAKYPKSFRKIIERKANGHAVINELKEDIIGIVPFEPDSSKLSRLRSVESLFEAGNVWLPDPSRAQWMHDYVEELVNFPNGAHDDQVDCTSQALIHMRENGDWLKQLNNW
jgi:predicted phage terminase large subunit-like protein